MKHTIALTCLLFAGLVSANDALQEMRAYCEAMPTSFPQIQAPQFDAEAPRIVRMGPYAGVVTTDDDIAITQFHWFSKEFESIFVRRKNDICAGNDPVNYLQRLTEVALESCQTAAPARFLGESSMRPIFAMDAPALTEAQQAQVQTEIRQFAETNCPILRHHLTSHQANWSSIWQSGLRAGRAAPAMAECGPGVNDDGVGHLEKASEAPIRNPAADGKVLSE